MLERRQVSALLLHCPMTHHIMLQAEYDNATLLIFHGAVYPQLLDCKLGGDHANAMGKRTHIVQLNKAAVHIMQQCVLLHWSALGFGAAAQVCLLQLLQEASLKSMSVAKIHFQQDDTSRAC